MTKGRVVHSAGFVIPKPGTLNPRTDIVNLEMRVKVNLLKDWTLIHYPHVASLDLTTHWRTARLHVIMPTW